MSISSNGKRLILTTKDLFLKWEQTKNFWKDARSREFEQKFLTELQANTDKSAEVIEQLDKLVAKIRSDCE